MLRNKTSIAIKVTLRKMIILAAALIPALQVYAQSIGDYRTTGASTDWNSNLSWEVYMGGFWFPASSPPDETSGTIYINDDININDAQSMSDVVISGSATLTVTGMGDFSMGSGTITGAGDFTLQSGGILRIGHPDGIDSLQSSGNIQNTGSMTLASDAEYWFNGTSAQVTGTGMPAIVETLGIDNPNGVTLTDDVEVTSAVDLQMGLFNTESATLYVGPDGFFINSSHDSYLIGPANVGWATDTILCKLLPFGTDTAYHPIENCMRHNNTGLNIYKCGLTIPTVNPYNIRSGSGIVQVNPLWSYFQDPIQLAAKSLLQQDITICWFEYDGVRDVGKIGVGQYIDNQEKWDEVNGTVSITGDSLNGCITFHNNSQDRRDYVLVSYDTTNFLPVTLLNFDGRPYGTGVLLEWATAQEINNSHFVLERASGGTDFREVVSVRGAGTSDLLHFYQYYDKELPNGTHFYKLTQIDFDGTTEVVGLVPVTIGMGSTVKLLPNPADQSVQVLLPEGIEESEITIVESSGKVVLQQTLRMNNHPEASIDLSTLAPGMYNITFSFGKSIDSQILTINR